jgi:histidinol-phosphate/aromatic aminotransferase/cobyric acid decarboxylase-like protein
VSEPSWILDPSEERLDAPGLVDLVYPIVQDYPPPERVLQRMRDAVPLVARYPHQEREVREALGRYLGVEAACILPSVGGNGALDLLSRGLLAGRTVAVPFPAFWQLVEAPRRYGASVVSTDLLGEGALERVLEVFSRADAIILCSPNNPLGQPVPGHWVERLLEVSRGRPVIVDESYADIPGTTFARKEAHPDLVLVRGFKTFLIPGARMGYVVAHPDRVRRLAALRPPFESNVVGEAAVLGVLEELEAVRAIWAQVTGDLRALEQGLLELGGTLEPSHTLFACWRHPRALRLGRALARRGIITMFGGRGVIHGMPEDCLRLTSRRPEVFRPVLETLKALLSSGT